MTVKEMMPFSEKSYNLSCCDLRLLDNENVGAISEVLASMDPWLTLGYSSDNLSKYLLSDDPALLKYDIVVLEI